ncbi:MAG TPA: hypothetical protein VD929_04585 [Caulobacteraceae bacterium]|nr:hypothetical protein [Caulobacteraceae bacterium]
MTAQDSTLKPRTLFQRPRARFAQPGEELKLSLWRGRVPAAALGRVMQKADRREPLEGGRTLHQVTRGRMSGWGAIWNDVEDELETMTEAQVGRWMEEDDLWEEARGRSAA